MWPTGTFQKVAIFKKKNIYIYIYIYILYIYSLYIYIYAYLVVPFLSCSMWDLIYMYIYIL